MTDELKTPEDKEADEAESLAREIIKLMQSREVSPIVRVGTATIVLAEYIAAISAHEFEAGMKKVLTNLVQLALGKHRSRLQAQGQTGRPDKIM